MSHHDSIVSSPEFFLNGRPERQKRQLRGLCVDRDGGTSIEVDFVPSVRYNIASMHVGGDGGLLARPIHPGPVSYTHLTLPTTPYV